MKARTVKLMLSGLAAAFLIACQGGTPTTGAKPEDKKSEKLVAVVNGNNITTSDFDREVKNLPEYLRSMAETPEGRKELIDTMVIRELILQQASKDGIANSKEVADKLEELKKRVVVEAYLKKKVEAESQVSDADMKKFYDQNADRFKTGEQIKASHILVKNEAEAKDILAKIKAGGNFEELAKKSSVDSSAAKGGDLGWFGKGTMVPAFEKAALALKEGQVSEVVKSDFGFHIIKLTGKRAAGVRPFDEVKDQIKAAILPGKQQEVFQKVKDELKKSANITIKDEIANKAAVKKDAEPAPAGAAPSGQPKPADPAKPAPADKK